MWQLVTEIVTGYHQCQIVMEPGWLSQLSSYEDGSGMDNEVYLYHRRSYSGLRRWFMQNDKLMRFKIVPGGRLDFTYARMCVSKIEGYGSLFSFK